MDITKYISYTVVLLLWFVTFSGKKICMYMLLMIYYSYIEIHNYYLYTVVSKESIFNWA